MVNIIYILTLRGKVIKIYTDKPEEKDLREVGINEHDALVLSISGRSSVWELQEIREGKTEIKVFINNF
jgi:hypothetical protein